MTQVRGNHTSAARRARRLAKFGPPKTPTVHDVPRQDVQVGTPEPVAS